MKTLIFVTSLFISSAFAQTLTATSFVSLKKEIEAQKFTYKETGKISGYVSTQSCLFIGQDIAVFRNYCFPVRPYPAKGYLILSRKYGAIQLYQEQLPHILMRDIRISQFPETLKSYLPSSFPETSLRELSDMIEEMYGNYFPACWSTNFSQYSETNEASCTAEARDVLNFAEWSQETQSIVMDDLQWSSLITTLEKTFTRP